MENWANCGNCKSFKLTDSIQTCDEFDLIGLPELFVVNTNNKCCSAFQANTRNVKTPDLNKMKYGVLYYYNDEAPDNLIENIDL